MIKDVNLRIDFFLRCKEFVGLKVFVLYCIIYRGMDKWNVLIGCYYRC